MSPVSLTLFPRDALSCLDLAIDLDSSSYKLYRLRSIAYSCLKDYEGSAADANRVIQLAPHVSFMALM
eukprot:1159726-Pelagomonas_calceolata.AAC.3